uniref:Uncharacterized protein n=1 Tax=Pseudomonas phage HRDY3 TaxID=3236930 RepID=A0AB39CEQ1_9VIRU
MQAFWIGVLVYLLIGAGVAVFALLYISAMRGHDESCHHFYYGLREATRTRRFLTVAMCCVYIAVLWLPLVSGCRVPPLPTVIRRK